MCDNSTTVVTILYSLVATASQKVGISYKLQLLGSGIYRGPAVFWLIFCVYHKSSSIEVVIGKMYFNPVQWYILTISSLIHLHVGGLPK